MRQTSRRVTGYITDARAGFQEDRDLGCTGQFSFSASLVEEGVGARGLRGKAGDSQVGKGSAHRVVNGFLQGHQKRDPEGRQQMGFF